MLTLICATEKEDFYKCLDLFVPKNKPTLVQRDIILPLWKGLSEIVLIEDNILHSDCLGVLFSKAQKKNDDIYGLAYVNSKEFRDLVIIANKAIVSDNNNLAPHYFENKKNGWKGKGAYPYGNDLWIRNYSR